MLGAQECLSITARRSALLPILGKDILAESRAQLAALRVTQAHLFKEVAPVGETEELVKPGELT